jgi:hypothetical protein
MQYEHIKGRTYRSWPSVELVLLLTLERDRLLLRLYMLCGEEVDLVAVDRMYIEQLGKGRIPLRKRNSWITQNMINSHGMAWYGHSNQNRLYFFIHECYSMDIQEKDGNRLHRIL